MNRPSHIAESMVAAATAAALLAGCETGSAQVPNETTHSETSTHVTPSETIVPTTPETSQTTTPEEERKARIDISAGFIAIDGYAKDDSTKNAAELLKERTPVLEAAVKRLNETTNGEFKVSLDYKNSVKVKPTAKELKVLRDSTLPDDLKLEAQKAVIDRAIDTLPSTAKPDVWVVSLDTNGTQTSNEAPDGTNRGFTDITKEGHLVAVELNRPVVSLATASGKPYTKPDSNVFEHELTHSVNRKETKVEHADTTQCNVLYGPEFNASYPLIMTDKVARNCEVVPRNDTTSVMSNTAEIDTVDPLNGVEMYQAGLLSDEQVAYLDHKGTETVTLDTLRSESLDAKKLIIVPIPAGVTVPIPKELVEANRQYAYALYLDSQQTQDDYGHIHSHPEASSIKVVIVGLTHHTGKGEPKPVGDTYIINIGNLKYYDKGLPQNIRETFFKDTRFGMSVAQAEHTAAQNASTATLTITRSK